MLPTSFTRMKSPSFCAGAKKIPGREVPDWKSNRDKGIILPIFFEPTKQTKV